MHTRLLQTLTWRQAQINIGEKYSFTLLCTKLSDQLSTLHFPLDL